MAYTKRIVCLANSFKPPNGRCIAGIELQADGAPGSWIRPVSARPTAELSYSDYRYQNGSSPKLLDIVDIPLLHAAPHNHQAENHVIDASPRWEKRGELSWDQLEQFQDRPGSLWMNNDHTSAGLYDCLSQGEAAQLNDSLLLIKAKNFTIKIGTSYWNGKKTYRGDFSYKNVAHNLSLTDPIARDVFGPKGEGDYILSDVYLCISLTEPYKEDGRCHKLVAAVIRNPPL